MPSFNSLLIGVLSLPIVQLAQGEIFTVNCEPLTIQRSDPIVSPGVMSGHVHAVVGGTGFQQTMTAETATSSGNTTCNRHIDRSNYWQPMLYHKQTDGQYEAIEFQGIVSSPINYMYCT